MYQKGQIRLCGSRPTKPIVGARRTFDTGMRTFQTFVREDFAPRRNKSDLLRNPIMADEVLVDGDAEARAVGDLDVAVDRLEVLLREFVQ